MGQRNGGRITMLQHQLLKANEFHQQCAYCGNDFQEIDAPTIIQQAGKEYLLFTCSSGHEQWTLLDMGNKFHRIWIEKNALRKHCAPIKKETARTLEQKLE